MESVGANRFTDCKRFLTFKMDDQLYGIPVITVLEVSRPTAMTKVLQAESYIQGLMQLRETVITVVNLRVKFGLKSVPQTRQTSVMLIENETSKFGVLVDSVNGVTTLNPDQISEAPFNSDAKKQSIIIGIGQLEKEIIILVDLQHLFHDDKSLNAQDLQQTKENFEKLKQAK